MEKIIARVKKMLNLAQDEAASEGERDNALRMAYNLMAKHNLSQATIDEASLEKQEPRIDFENRSHGMVWARHVNSIIAKLFFCESYITLHRGQTKVTYHFIGRESNAMTAAVMAEFVVNSIRKEAAKLYGYGSSNGTGFALGAVHRLSDRVEEIIANYGKQDSAPGTALVLANLYHTEEEANSQLLPANLKKSRKQPVAEVDPQAYYRGKAFGDKINLNKQVGQEEKEEPGKLA